MIYLAPIAHSIHFPLALPKLPRSGDSLQPGLRVGEVWFSQFV
eukprot:COSAG02_NODE_29026_length_577_cov_1.062762_1_plen_42_part_10